MSDELEAPETEDIATSAEQSHDLPEFAAGDRTPHVLVEMLEDLVLAAVAEAQKRAAELYQAEVRKLAPALPFPFQLPPL